MAKEMRLVFGSWQNWFTNTELASVASGTGSSNTKQSAIDLSNPNLLPFVQIEGVFNYSTNPAANSGCRLWLLRGGTSSTIETGSTSLTRSFPDHTFLLLATTGAQQCALILLPTFGADTIRGYWQNTNSGQTTASTGNSIRARFGAFQSIDV